MTNPMIRIHNIETNEIIDRQMNAKELAEYEKQQSVQLEELAANQAAALAKTALLQRLGITADEAALLLS